MAIVRKSITSATARHGAGATLSATSEAGDLAVIVASGQHESTIEYGPVGWEQTKTNFSGRSGYIAWRRVENPLETQNILWYDTNVDWAARQNAILFIFSGVASISATPWAWDEPVFQAQSYYVSQQHNVANAKFDAWTAGEVVYEGRETWSSTVSWSCLRAAVAGPITHFEDAYVAGWTTFTLTPDAPTPGLMGALSVWQNGVEKYVHKLSTMPEGVKTASALLAKNNFVVAHRGGSIWPEHTKRAYTNSVARGVDALEMSFSCTTDGVFYGCHDQNLERLGGPSTPANQLSWAEVVAAMSNTLYMPIRLDWLLSTYGKTHTLVLDPKHIALTKFDAYTELLAPYKDSIFFKFNGDALWMFEMWKNAGFRTWGYFYPSGQAETWWNDAITGPLIDTLSLEWNAEQSVWDFLKSSGKVVTSHIPMTKAAYDVGNARGATGSMVANVRDVLTLKV